MAKDLMIFKFFFALLKQNSSDTKLMEAKLNYRRLEPLKVIKVFILIYKRLSCLIKDLHVLLNMLLTSYKNYYSFNILNGNCD